MNFKKKILTLIPILLSLVGFSQKDQKSYSFPFDQINQSYQLINPSVNYSEEKVKALLGYNNFNRLSNDVYSMYAWFAYSIYSRDNLKKSTFNISVLPEKEGRYINKTKIYSGYSLSLPINKQFFFSTGFRVGLINYSISAPGGNSVFTPDAALGVSINSDNFKISLSANQILNSSLKLYVNPIIFSRFYTGLIEKDFILNELWNIKASLFSLFNTPSSNLTGSCLFYYQNRILFGSSLRKQYGLIAQAGVDNIHFQELLFTFISSYRFNVNQKSVIGTNRIEITLGIKFQ